MFRLSHRRRRLALQALISDPTHHHHHRRLLLLLLLSLLPKPPLQREAALSTQWNQSHLLAIFQATPRPVPRRVFEYSFSARRDGTKVVVVKNAQVKITYRRATWTLYELHHPRLELYTLVRRMSLVHWLALMVVGPGVGDVGLLELHRGRSGYVEGFWWQCEMGMERVYFKRTRVEGERVKVGERREKSSWERIKEAERVKRWEKVREEERVRRGEKVKRRERLKRAEKVKGGERVRRAERVKRGGKVKGGESA